MLAFENVMSEVKWRVSNQVKMQTRSFQTEEMVWAKAKRQETPYCILVFMNANGLAFLSVNEQTLQRWRAIRWTTVSSDLFLWWRLLQCHTFPYVRAISKASFSHLERSMKHNMTSTSHLVKLSTSLPFLHSLWMLYGIQSLVDICYKKIRNNIHIR